MPSGTLTSGQRAELERVLIAYWCKRLQLTEHRPADAMATLRAHPEAGKLIRQLEDWLHRPGAKTDPGQLESLLADYEYVQDELVDVPGERSAVAGTSQAASRPKTSWGRWPRSIFSPRRGPRMRTSIATWRC